MGRHWGFLWLSTIWPWTLPTFWPSQIYAPFTYHVIILPGDFNGSTEVSWQRFNVLEHVHLSTIMPSFSLVLSKMWHRSKDRQWSSLYQHGGSLYLGMLFHVVSWEDGASVGDWWAVGGSFSPMGNAHFRQNEHPHRTQAHGRFGVLITNKSAPF
jgi:hypothetical protein